MLTDRLTDWPAVQEQLAARKVEEEKASKKKKKPLPNHEDAEPTADDEGSPAVTAPEGAQLTLEERIASAESMTDYTAETIAAEMHLDVSKVKDVIRRLSDHYMRMQNVQGTVTVQKLQSEIHSPLHVLLTIETNTDVLAIVPLFPS